jgi:nucleosome assembly protein 1-like 1
MQIVVGTVDVPTTTTTAASSAPKGIPDFWLQALQNNRHMGDFIEEHDVPVLKSLTDIKVKSLDDFHGFALEFTFAPNDYFEDSVLTKTFKMDSSLLGTSSGGEPEVTELVGCEIHWKDGKDVTVKNTKKTVKKGGKKKTVVKSEPVPSFFRFFETPDMEPDEDMSPEDQYALIEQLDAEVSAGSVLKNKIVPNAVAWFTGEAQDDESDDEEYDDEDDEDDDDYDDEEDDDEEEGENHKTVIRLERTRRLLFACIAGLVTSSTRFVLTVNCCMARTSLTIVVMFCVQRHPRARRAERVAKVARVVNNQMTMRRKRRNPKRVRLQYK